jgi:hypothetical protein
MEESAHESSGGNHDGLPQGAVPEIGFDALDGVILHEDANSIPLPQSNT